MAPWTAVGGIAFGPYAALEKVRESYTGRIIYENGEAETVGQVTVRCPTVAAYTANIATVLGNAALATAMGGTAAHATTTRSRPRSAAAPRAARSTRCLSRGTV